MDKKSFFYNISFSNTRIVLFKRQDDKPCAATIETYLKRKKFFKIKEEKKGKGAICKFSYFKNLSGRVNRNCHQ